MDFDSPDVMKDFPGLYASELHKQCSNDSDYSDENEKVLKKDIIGKRKDKKDKGYAALEGESSADENCKSRSPSKSKKPKSFKFSTKVKEKRDKSREKEKEVEKKKDKEKKNDKKCDKDKLKNEKPKKLKQFDETSDIGDILPIFGTSLEIAVERSKCHDGVNIPLPVRECIDYIESSGILFEGLYKISGTKSKVLQIRKAYNQRANIKLIEYDIPTVTSLLKSFIRDLPEPLFTSDLLIRFEEAGAILNLNTREKHLKILVDNLPSYNHLLLAWLVTHLNNVSLNEKYNKMSKQNLATALHHTFHCSSRLLHALIQHSPALFPDIKIEQYIPPLESGASLPSTPQDINNELLKQESLLNQIHKEMNVACISKQREELLWEAQRMITQLKRKLKTANKGKEMAEKNDNLVVEEKEIEKVENEPIVACSNNEEVKIASNGVEAALQDDFEEKEVISDDVISLLQLKNDGLNSLKESLLNHIERERSQINTLKTKLNAITLAEDAIPDSYNDLDAIMDVFLKENQILQVRKINLVRQIIEEQEICIELRAQLTSLL